MPRAITTKKKRTTSTSKFRSGLEESIAKDLETRSIPYEYEQLKLKYTVEREYKPDFILPNGILVEAKGYFKSEDQRKMRSVKASNPDLDIRMLFQRASGKVQGSQMSNIQWCTKYGFQWCEGTIPQAWIEE
jgi:hypothetical protein